MGRRVEDYSRSWKITLLLGLGLGGRASLTSGFSVVFAETTERPGSCTSVRLSVSAGL